MRIRFTFVSMLLLILVLTGYFLSYMAGFLQIDARQAVQSLRFWEDPRARQSSVPARNMERWPPGR